jgi:hypothetical protein
MIPKAEVSCSHHLNSFGAVDFGFGSAVLHLDEGSPLNAKAANAIDVHPDSLPLDFDLYRLGFTNVNQFISRHGLCPFFGAN